MLNNVKAVLKFQARISLGDNAVKYRSENIHLNLHNDARICIESVIQYYSFGDHNAALPELMIEMSMRADVDSAGEGDSHGLY